MRSLLVVVALSGGAAADVHSKPQAPVTVTLDASAAPGGYAVKLVATATRAVPAIELTVAGKTIAFPATAAGQRRELTVHVPVAAGGGTDVIGSARAGGRNRAAVLHVGVPVAQIPRRSTIRTLPDGRAVKEVR